MSHPMQMSLSLTGWSVEPELLDNVAIELVHSEGFGDTIRIKFHFKDGREFMTEADLKDGEGIKVFDALQEGISGGSHAGIVS
jgi:hypothetical protein